MARKRRTEAAPARSHAREIPAGEFKAKCLALMDRVREQHEEYVITKHGKPVAKLVPVGDEDVKPKSAFGWMKGTVIEYGDIISPVAEDDWEVLQDDEGGPRDHD
jgi:prevent-host-death family protein